MQSAILSHILPLAEFCSAPSATAIPPSNALIGIFQNLRKPALLRSPAPLCSHRACQRQLRVSALSTDFPPPRSAAPAAAPRLMLVTASSSIAFSSRSSNQVAQARARGPLVVIGAAAPSSSSPSSPPSLPLLSITPVAGGQLNVVQWREGRALRIWTPPGFSLSNAVQEPYPVLYLNDGQNLYGDTPTLSGSSWHAAEAAAGLIASGALPPFVIVGIDHAGAMRSYDYLPYPPGNAGGYRLDADKWPGGGVDAYLRAVQDEILPYVERTYGVSSKSSLRGFGGSSFGGICALSAALRAPGVFGGLLVESPSLWFADERMLRQDVPSFPGPWPERVFLAMGTQEYSAVRSAKQPDFDSRLVSYTHQLADMLERQGGLVCGQRLWVEVEEGATHNERAWAGRLPRALAFLGQGWRATMAAAATGSESGGGGG